MTSDEMRAIPGPTACIVATCRAQVEQVWTGDGWWAPVRCPSCEAEHRRRADQQSQAHSAHAAKLARWQRSSLSPRHVGFLKGGAEAVIRDEVKRLVGEIFQGRSLYLHGDTGTWKTTRAVQIGRLCIQMAPLGPDLTYWTEASFLLEMRSRFAHRGEGGASANALLDEVSTIPLLIFDDLGMSNQRTPACHDWLLSLISARYEAQLPTVWTSNVPITGLEPVIGPRALRRIKEGAQSVPCKVPKYRGR